MTHFIRQRKNGLVWLMGPQLAEFPWLVHAFSTRLGGASGPPAEGLNLASSPSSAMVKNRRAFTKALSVAPWPLASLHQIHSAEIFEVKTPNFQFRPSGHEPPRAPRRDRRRGDALLTHEARVLLGVRTADCLPVLIADPRLRVVAAVHSGWRGALKCITQKTVGEMQRLYGSKPEQLFAALGPSVRACCYEVGDEVVDAFTGRFVKSASYFKKIGNPAAGEKGFPGMPFLSEAPPGHARPAGSGIALDLTAVARDQLRSAGLPLSHIQTAEFCTSCRTDLFFSYRKEGAATGRMMAVIGVKGKIGGQGQRFSGRRLRVVRNAQGQPRSG